MYFNAIILMCFIVNCIGTDPLGDGWGRNCSSLAWSKAWQTFYPYIYCGHCSYVTAIISSARLAGTHVNLFYSSV